MLYQGICRFCAIFRRFGGKAAFGPLGSASEGNGSPPPVNTYVCTPTEFKDDIFTDYFQKVHANSPPHWQILSQNQPKTFRSRRRGSLVDSDSDSSLVATTPATPTPTPHPWNTVSGVAGNTTR